MQKIGYGLTMLGILLCLATSAVAEVRIGIRLPHVSIGINLPHYPELVAIPGYPVYYAPRLTANFFFYDGMYWVYQNDIWYTSDWYNGPWWAVDPDYVPIFILRVPVRYYRHPPRYFYGWPVHAPPRWGLHWGRDWERRHRDWDHWDHRSVPVIAPRPDYQKLYSGNRYPRREQQLTLRQQHYRYQIRDKIIREQIRPQIEEKKPATMLREGEEERGKTPRQQSDPDDRRSQQTQVVPPPQKLGMALRELQKQSESDQQRGRGQDQEVKRQEQEQGQKKGWENKQGKDQERGKD